MTDYTNADDVKKRLAGDIPSLAMSDAFDATIAAKVTEVSADIDRLVKVARGVKGDWSFLADTEATVRQFMARGGQMLPIDDCVEVDQVTLLNMDGSAMQDLSSPFDYVLEPIQGTPIVGLMRMQGVWGRYSLVAVTAKWGYATSIPPDVTEAAIIEIIRSYLSDRAGNDDRLGLTPFGSVITAKAYTSKVMELVSDYSYGGGSLR